MNYKEYFAIEKTLRNKGFDFDRSELIDQFTNGKKKGLTALSAWEYKEFLLWLNRSFQNQPQQPTDSERKDKMRKKIIAILCKMGYKKPQGGADMPRIQEWATKYGATHKTFNAYSYIELTQLVTQAELMYNKYLKAL